MIVKKCKGCGAILQNQEEEKAGFIPNLTENSMYCKRCFRMKNYGELPKIVATNKEYEMVIDQVVKRNGLMIFIVDLFAFKATFHQSMIDKLKNKDVIIVANKYDVFPKSTNPSSIVEWVSRQCQKIHFKVSAIHIVSSKKMYFIDDLMRTIDWLRRGRDVYFVGCANVGKSSLINALLKRNTTMQNDLITTSVIPGTTLSEIRIPFFEDNQALVDTPGLINPSDVLNQLLPNSYLRIVPNKEMKPKTFQLTSGHALFLGGLACLKFFECHTISVIVYTSAELYLHRCKVENVDKLWETQLGNLLTPPTKEEMKELEYEDKEVFFDGKKKMNIWFSGFGFVTIIGKCDCKIRYIKKTEVYVTNGIIGFGSENSK